MQNSCYFLSQTALRFRRWSRNRFAAFYSIGRHVVIGQLKNTIANASLSKTVMVYGFIESVKDFDPENQKEFELDEALEYLILENLFHEHSFIPSASFGSDVSFCKYNHKTLSVHTQGSNPAYAHFFYLINSLCMNNIEKIKVQIMQGAPLLKEQIDSLINAPRNDLYLAAQEITQTFMQDKFDTCSIINAKSGRCPEDCKWCAQSAHYKTSSETYGLLPTETCLEHALYNQKQGIHRFSLVTSGRKLNTTELSQVCNTYREIKKKSNINLCASLGLLEQSEMEMLASAGVTRYHCNLETAPGYFSQLCTTHTQKAKIKTIRAAISAGMDICCGGIIGMGESREDRIELAFTLRNLNIKSIPINILVPIPGTPLEAVTPLTEDEILLTIALFRFINPDAFLRFSGGRGQISRGVQQKALYIGINSAIVGDLLTTIGSSVAEDMIFFKQTGYKITDNNE